MGQDSFVCAVYCLFSFEGNQERDKLMLLSYALGILGTWLIADGTASIVLYYGKKDETWVKNHCIRLIRIVVGIAIIIIGARFQGII